MLDELHDHDLTLDAEEHVFRRVSGPREGGAVEQLVFGDDLDSGVLASLGVSRDADAACGEMGRR